MARARKTQMGWLRSPAPWDSRGFTVGAAVYTGAVLAFEEPPAPAGGDQAPNAALGRPVLSSDGPVLLPCLSLTEN